MKKLFTKFFALIGLMLIGGGSVAWASDVKDLVAITGDYTMIFDNITQNGTASPTAGSLYFDKHLLTPVANTKATNKGSSTIGEGSHLNSLRLKNAQDYIVFKVGAPCTVKFYTQSHDSRGVGLAASATTTYLATQTFATTVYEYELTAAELAKYTNGVIYAMGNGGDFYIAGIEFIFPATSYNVTYQNDGNGTLTGAATAKAGSTVNVTATPNSGYRFDYLTVNDTKQNAGVKSFTMPNEAATVKAFFAQAINVTGVSLNEASVEMMKFSQTTLAAIIAPADATNQNVTWSSDNEAVATVENGVVTAKSAGTATITVTTEDGSMTATCNVTVTDIPGNILFSATPVDGKTLNVAKQTAVEVADEYATISGGTMSLFDGHKDNAADMIYANQFNVAASGGSYVHVTLDNALKAGDVITVLDYNGEALAADNSLYVSTSDSKGSTGYKFPYVVTESSVLKGQKDLYFWKYGASAFKTITVNGKLVPTIEVSDAAVSVDMNSSTSVTFTSNSTGNVTVSSDKTSVATASVEGNTITINGVAGGTATITVSQEATENYSEGSQTITVTVVDPYAPSVIYAWNTVGTTTLSGTAAAGEVSVKNVNTAGIKFGNGLSADNYLKIESKDGGFKAGDVISWTGVINNKDNAKQGGIMIVSDISDMQNTVQLACSELFNNSYDANVEASTGSFTVTEDAECLYIGRATSGLSGATATWLTSLSVSRPVSETVEITSAGYATFSAPVALDLDYISGGEAYVVVSVDGEKVVTEPATGVVPANTGLIIKGAEGTCSIPVSAEAGETPAENLLEAVTEDNTVIASGYVLGVEGEEVMFLKIEGVSATLKAGKAYLPAQVGGNARALRFVSESTGITNVATATKDGVIYNIAGQRVSGNAKGLVIMNGKKFNIK